MNDRIVVRKHSEDDLWRNGDKVDVNLKAVPPRFNCLMTSLTKVDKNHEQKNEGTISFLSNFDNLKAIPPRVNCSMTSLTKVD